MPVADRRQFERALEALLPAIIAGIVIPAEQYPQVFMRISTEMFVGGFSIEPHMAAVAHDDAVRDDDSCCLQTDIE